MKRERSVPNLCLQMASNFIRCQPVIWWNLFHHCNLNKKRVSYLGKKRD